MCLKSKLLQRASKMCWEPPCFMGHFSSYISGRVSELLVTKTAEKIPGIKANRSVYNELIIQPTTLTTDQISWPTSLPWALRKRLPFLWFPWPFLIWNTVCIKLGTGRILKIASKHLVASNDFLPASVGPFSLHKYLLSGWFRKSLCKLAHSVYLRYLTLTTTLIYQLNVFSVSPLLKEDIHLSWHLRPSITTH